MSKYTLTLTARQASEISSACEIVARLQMGQVDMAVRELPGEQPKNYDALREIQQMIERLVPAKIERGNSIAWDLYQVIRHRLSWDDVDIVDWVIHVKRARVEGIFKVPKERSRIRRIELVEPAKIWLQRQRESTYLQPPVIISVSQRDNVTVKADTFRPVFRNGQSNQPWNYVSLMRWFTGHLRRANVRHRGPNQCRHTFASQMLSNYVSMEWVARQLGHTDTTMVKKHYGRWIQKDTPNMAGQVSQMLGYTTDRNGLENPDSAPILPQNQTKK